MRAQALQDQHHSLEHGAGLATAAYTLAMTQIPTSLKDAVVYLAWAAVVGGVTSTTGILLRYLGGRLLQALRDLKQKL